MIKRISAAALSVAFLMMGMPTPGHAQTQQPAAEPKKPAKASTKKRSLTPGQRAARERQRACGAEWKTARASGKVDKKMKWPQFWSECNKRLKAGT